MNDGKIYTVIGLMSGTSLDGIDAALMKTDGLNVVEFGPSLTIPYEDGFTKSLRRFLGRTLHSAPGVQEVEHALTLLHIDGINALLKKANLTASDIGLIGFHGHTVHHDPSNQLTVQLGDGGLMADRLGIPVVSGFRLDDVAAGGEGAPLVPIFHAALVRRQLKIARPCAVVNIGGVANVTWIGDAHDDLLAFDTGPGNAPLNDWVYSHTGQSMDVDGQLASEGVVDSKVLNAMLAHGYFDRIPPKSLDRQDFSTKDCKGLSLQDGAATLTAYIAKAIGKARIFFPTQAQTWVITGGGRLNPVLMADLKDILKATVLTAEDVGWDGDALEAQAFAYLAVRCKKNLPMTFPATTGGLKPLSGGTLHLPQSQ